jgi:DNA-binding response OmpR family regulator
MPHALVTPFWVAVWLILCVTADWFDKNSGPYYFEQSPMSETTNKKILLVEDEAEVRQFLQTTLEMEGYTVLTAPNGVKLISKIRVDKPHVVLLDIMLPWVDGYELCKAIKAHPEYRRIPVIFVSVRNSEEEIQAGRACGADDYITKPIDIETFLATVRKHAAVNEVG